MNKLLFFLLLPIASGLTAQTTRERPNVILVMTDDQGYGDLSCHGNPVLQTPEIDRLYKESIRFTDYHVTPMCTPSRGQLMTGIDAARNGAVNVSSGRTSLHTELPTMANFFADNGYRTGIFGKWHLGDNYPYWPQLRGFQESIWFPSSHISSVPDFWGNKYFDDTYIHNGKQEKFNGYCTDVFTTSAINWIAAAAKTQQPFFAYLPLNAPHAPWFAPEENVKEMEAAIAKSPFAGLEPKLKDNLTHYLAMIRRIDYNIGRLIDFLNKTGLADNTILIFTTDNGGTFTDYYNAGMRGKKTELWEGGHRVPFFIRWPHGSLGAPRDIAGLTQVQDVLPTLIGLCGLVTPEPPHFNGISLAPVLHGAAKVPDRTLVINYSRMPSSFDYPSPASPSIMRKDGSVVLWRRWRLVEDRMLFDLDTDPLEKNNVIDHHPDIAARLHDKLDTWWSEVAGTANEPRPVIIGSDSANPMVLNSCEWMDVLLDQQQQVLGGLHRNSYWNIRVARAGKYEFELRRWPREADLALAASPPNGKALPIAGARFAINGEVRKQKLEPGSKAAVFTARLDAGPLTLHSWFDDKDGQSICGAYYIYVRRK
ncbi:MAG TPA: arylsulfatase [Puia sp.]|jgi:arylsulfatase